MLNNKKFIYIFLGIIFFIALLFRFVNLSSYPTGFHIDEASLGYNGYSLLLTGKDDNGNSFPLYIDMFGDNRPSGYHYLTIVPIMIFGLTEFATRFPGALIGSLTIFVMFLFANAIFKNQPIGLLSALLVAISPWHIIVSRASGEAVVALFFILLGFSLLLWALEENKNKFIISCGAIFATISYFFYHTPRVFVPLIFASLSIFLYPLWKNKRKLLGFKILGIFIFLCSVTLILVFLVKGGTGRYSQVNIFNNFETNFFMWQQLQEDTLAQSPKYISRVLHNKITNNFLVFIDNYFDYFSGGFLFAKGGLPNWYNVPRMGLMYLLELPFLIVGIYWLIKSNNRMHKVPLVWLLVVPIIPAITMDDIPNINRSIAMIPSLETIVAVGFLNSVNIIRKKNLFVGLSILLFLGNILYFGHQYFVNAKIHKGWYRNNGFSEMMKVVNENYNKYDTIVISKFQGGIYPLVLFYSKYDPATYQKEGSTKNTDYSGFGKFFFVPQDCPSVQRTNKLPKVDHILFIDKGDCPLEKFLKNKKIKYIYREDRTKVFRIVYE